LRSNTRSIAATEHGERNQPTNGGERGVKGVRHVNRWRIGAAHFESQFAWCERDSERGLYVSCQSLVQRLERAGQMRLRPL
jgi:hypothetical protein